VSELVAAATPREEVAADDRFIAQVEATGIYGAIVAGADGPASLDPDFDRLTDGVSTDVLFDVTELDSEQITFEVTADSETGNQEPLEINLENGGDGDTFVILDEENGQFFLVADTSSDNAFANGDAPDEATDFTVDIEYNADNEADRFEFSDGTSSGVIGGDNDPFSQLAESHQNYPYLQQGETLSNSATLSVAPRSVDYDNINENDVVQAENTAESVISGESNVAPGSEVSLRVQSTDASSSFRQGNDINITEDGSFETQYDLSGQEVGDEFDTNFRVEGSSTDSTNSVIVEEGTLSTAEPADEEEDTNETDTDGGEDADDGEEPADDGEEPADDGSADDGSTDDGTPGFGAVVALIALIGAALLAVRRQN
jgi:PGF-CTERM protein